MQKINQLLSIWPKGTVKSTKELIAADISYQLVAQYVKSGWLQPLGRGAYKLNGDVIELHGAVYSLQRSIGLKLHPGGKTALILKGFGHYMSDTTDNFHLYYSGDVLLPEWFRSVWKNKIKSVKTEKFNYSDSGYFTDHTENTLKIKISSPELAVVEMLNQTPSLNTVTETVQIMEGLMNLRADLLIKILNELNSVKVNRLILFISERTGLPCFPYLRDAGLNLGSGKRKIAENGFLEKKYNITLPDDLKEFNIL
ncbi:MAG: type IV toxin-antitoxin system AbiEi family antitoxin domain-containing protein [Ignavibacteriaceae bacterium]|nr:type IV toxin-antitoxin system AbiEi family antitoxin domain-containing protein [Ignavibacteriaceae bacterium]